MTKIFVMDGQTVSALSIIRSLGEKGFEIHCGEEFRYNLSSFSKYVKKEVVYPSPIAQPDQFCDFILNLIKQEKYDLIIPVADHTTLLLSKHQKNISTYTRLYLADFKILSKLSDKGETIKIARKLSIPTPKTYFPEEMDIDTIKNCAKYPVLIRPRVSAGSRGIKYVSSPLEFDSIYDFVKKEYGDPIVQEYIFKTGYFTACILLDDTQNEIASFVYKRIKEYPLSGGPTVVGVAWDNPEVKAYSLELLRSVGWKGVAEIEYIVDSDGKPLLLEVNPRFWMSLNLAVKSGVDFPYLLYKLATHEKTEPTKLYNLDSRYRWVLPYEILWLIHTPNKAKGLKEFFNFWDKNTCYADLSLDDPMPVIGILFQSLYFLLNSEKRKMIFQRGW